jgi:uncharacterized membrane protein YgdD (TMEM256/DUF423 family)
MGKINVKKLLIGSIASFAAGFILLFVTRLMTARTMCYPNGCLAVDFMQQWIAPIGQFLAVLSIVLVIASIVVKLGSPKSGLSDKVIIKRQSIASAVLLIVGSAVFLFSQWKLSNLSAYYDRRDVEWYGSIVSPFGGLLFLLGFAILYTLVLKSKKHLIDEEHNS